jgi:hypothetical protein
MRQVSRTAGAGLMIGRQGGPPPVAAPAPVAVAADAADDAVRFTVVVLLASLLLQRFALPMGELPFSIVGPIGLLCGAFWMLRGTLVMDERRIIALLVLAAIGFISSLLSLTAATARLAAISWTSLSQFLLLSLFAPLAFRQAVDEERYFKAFNACLAFVGVAGILQFFAQLGGVFLISFVTLGVPTQYTLESFYNIYNPTGIGGLFKSNGFFMVEASVYSQFMAMGLAIEFTYSRRIRYLAIFALGLVLSFSGTGWLIMGAFVVGAVARQGGRGLKIGLGALSAAGVGLGVLAVASPELFEQYVGRVGEFTTPGSSGHLRFVTPWWAMSDFMGETPWALLVGGGAGVSERLHTQFTYFYGVNTPMKIALEYGLPGLVAYLALFLAADRTPRQSTLLAPALMFFLFTGTYAQFPPILFPVLLITSVARLRPTPAPPSNRVRPAAAGGTLAGPALNRSR